MALSVKNMLGGGGSIGAVENLLVPTLGTVTDGGITCTNNGNGTYTFSGTANADRGYCVFEFCKVSLGVGQYKLVGDIADDMGVSSHFLQLIESGGIDVHAPNKQGATFNATSNVNNATVRYIVANGVALNGTIKPMLTTNTKATYKEFVKRVGGFNNLFVPTAPTQTVNGITFTNNGNGTYTLNGTTGSSSASLIVGNVSMEDGKQYKLTGCPEGGKNGNTSYYEIQYGQPVNGLDHGHGAICQGSSSADSRVWISVFPNKTVNNLIFKPMLTESLLPEYFDFVKGVEGIDSLYDILDCTGMVKGSITPTSDLDSLTITHNIGVVPKAVFLEIDDASIPTTNVYYTSRVGLAKYYTSAFGWVVGGRNTTKDLGQTTKSGARWYTTTLEVPVYNTSYPYRSGYKYNYIILY